MFLKNKMAMLQHVFWNPVRDVGIHGGQQNGKVCCNKNLIN